MDDKTAAAASSTDDAAAGHGVDELARIIDNHLNPVSSASPTLASTVGATRTYTPPLMGTSARAAKRRLDSDGGPIRIEGTDTYNQQLQHHYQNVRQILEDQQQGQTSTVDTTSESPQSFIAKREFFEQRFKTPPPTYDSPPRQAQHAQQIITTITTTTTTGKPGAYDRTSSSSNESPTVDHVIEQAVELQKLSQINSAKSEPSPPVIIERTEQYQVLLDSSNHEVRRTPSVSRTSLVPVTKTGHATDLDQAQAQAERTTDDHQAIQKLTRVLQEHNQTSTTDNSWSLSNTNPVSVTTLPSSEIRLERVTSPIASEFTVIDALLNNPLGTIDNQSNHLLQLRYNDILSNVRNPAWIHSLKETALSKGKPEPKKKSKEKAGSSKKATPEKTVVVPLVNTSEQLSSSTTTEPLVLNSSEQTPLIDSKDKTKQKKEAKKKPKTKAKDKSTAADYQVIDAIIGSPICLRLPDPYLTKYKMSPPLSQSSPLSSPSSILPTALATTDSSKDNNVPVPEKNETLFSLVKIVHELHLHHAAALTASVTIPSPKTTGEPKGSLESARQAPVVVKEVVQQQPLLAQRQQPTRTQPSVALPSPPPAVSSVYLPESRPQSDPIKPRVVYRYIDEQGRVLAMSSTPPSQLREQPSQKYAYRNAEPTLLYDRHIAIDDERRHLLPQYEQRATWQGEPKLPTTVTREDFELRDKRIPQLSEQTGFGTRTIPVSYEPDHPSRNPGQPPQQRVNQYPNQQNVKLAWLPLSYPSEQSYIPSGAAGYDTDSTISERSATFRPYDYGPADTQYRYSNRPLYTTDYRSTRSPGPSYYPPPPPLPYSARGISPEYGTGSQSRNYLEVFRGGDFQDNKPSEVYSLPINEHVRRSPIQPGSNRHSRYDQYQSEKYGTMANRRGIPSLQPNYYYTDQRYTPNIQPPAPTVYASSYYTHRSPHHRTVQSSPHPELNTYIRPSKSFDYRPLRTKLQREYKITPNLLVDEWEYPSVSEKIHYSTATSTTNRSGVSSPDDVFFSNRTSTG